jgi:hypothetical protein
MNTKNTVTVVVGLLLIILLLFAFVRKSNDDKQAEILAQAHLDQKFFEIYNNHNILMDAWETKIIDLNKATNEVDKKVTELNNKPAKVTAEDISLIRSGVKSELINELVNQMPSAFKYSAYCVASTDVNETLTLQCRDRQD